MEATMNIENTIHTDNSTGKTNTVTRILKIEYRKIDR